MIDIVLKIPINSNGLSYESYSYITYLLLDCLLYLVEVLLTMLHLSIPAPSPGDLHLAPAELQQVAVTALSTSTS